MFADGSSGRLFHFPVAGDRCATAVRGVPIDGVVRALALETATVSLEVPDQVSSLHAAGMSTDRVSQRAFPGASFLALSR